MNIRTQAIALGKNGFSSNDVVLVQMRQIKAGLILGGRNVKRWVMRREYEEAIAGRRVLVSALDPDSRSCQMWEQWNKCYIKRVLWIAK